MIPRTPTVSVVICTHNRSADVKIALSSLLDQKGWQNEDEIIVVDNASRDKTREVVELAAIDGSSMGIKVKYLYERKIGLSHARNTGYKSANNSIVIYLDDDAKPVGEWLMSMRSPFKEEHVGAVGGPIMPLFEIAPPSWLGSDFAVRDIGIEGPLSGLSARTGFAGGNMAIRKMMIHELGGFDVNLGMKGSGLAFGEETDFFTRLYRHYGNVTYFSKGAVVLHKEPAFKQEINYVIQRLFYIANLFPAHAVAGYGVPVGLVLSLSKVVKQLALGLGYGVSSFLGKGYVFKCLRGMVTAAGVFWGIARLFAVKDRGGEREVLSDEHVSP